MQALITQLDLIENYKEGLRATCKMNRIPGTLLGGLTFKKMRIFSQRTLKHYDANPLKATTNWFQNELRLYHWVLIIHSFLLSVPLLELQPSDWTQIHEIFFPKPLEMLQFEARKLVSSSPAEQHRAWLPAECQLLREVMTDSSLSNRWNEVSRCLYERSDRRYYRSGKQCREQWFNHLDNSKKHGEWTPQEDRIILEFVLQHGHRWAQLCREALASRTEHMIKNRFKSLMLKQTTRGECAAQERKIIRRMLAKGVEVPEGNEEEPFKIVHLRTYHTDQQDPLHHAQDSLLHLLAPADGNSVINNIPADIIPAERQNYQNQEESPPCPEGHHQPSALITTLPLLPQQNLYAFYPWQTTEMQMQTMPHMGQGGSLLPYYGLYSSSFVLSGSMGSIQNPSYL